MKLAVSGRASVRLWYGGDYNPEQWPEPVWTEDVALMRRAGVNLVSLGVFAWARLEPEEGRYAFDWLDRVMDLLAAGGVRVALATPTASPPPWFGLAYPDAMTVNRDGIRLAHGSRDTYCLSAPAYRAACVRIAGELARRYAGHPALALWHAHNEYGTGCYCDHAAAAFRAWLRGCHGDLDRLNESWSTALWSQHYSTEATLGLEVVRRTGEDVSWLFALNHTDQPQEVPVDGVDLISNEDVVGTLRLPPGGVAVIRTGAGGPPRT